MREVIIQSDGQGKGRTFQAIITAYVEADRFWEGGQTGNNIRPVWAQFAGTDSELRAFAANLISGKKATFTERGGWNRGKENRIEVLRSAGYETSWQREVEGSIFTVFQGNLFRMDPGMVDPLGLRFLVLPSRAWHTSQQLDSAPMRDHLASCGYELTAELCSEWTPLAYLFAAYLDRRTRCPLIADGRFYIQLLVACLHEGLASLASDDNLNRQAFGIHRSFDYHETNIQAVGFMGGLAFLSSHERFEEVLARQVATYFKVQKGQARGTHR